MSWRTRDAIASLDIGYHVTGSTHRFSALIELAPAGSEERSILESLSNHIASRGGSCSVSCAICRESLCWSSAARDFGQFQRCVKCLRQVIWR